MPEKKANKTGMAETLLVELLTEELPPKALQRLSQVFCDALAADLRQDGLLAEPCQAKAFATPRRLAVSISNVLAKAPDKPVEIQGPSLKVGLDAEGKPTQALVGFAKKNGVAVDELTQIDTPKGKVFACRKVASGTHLETNLDLKVAAALEGLPVPKIMRWGAGEAKFARPVHGLVMLHGSRIIPGEVLGASSSNKTLGHRFLSGDAIVLKHADDYERALRDKGKMIVDFSGRQAEITKQLERTSGGAALVASDALLDEVTALVEAPAVYAGEFSSEFLTVPEECLILSMQQHQKYVPLRDKKTGKLLPRFLFVSNIETKQPREIIHGNERVLRARLSDAKFFYDQDRKTRLEARVPRLANVVYHNKLGSQLERVERIQLLAGKIARELGADPLLAERAAWLSKADLLTDMVGEFPELQGGMGRYYALHDGEPQEIADAIGDQYKLRRDELDPENLTSSCLYLADRIELMTGLFGIGERPTGEKDPYGLRRAALGIINVFEKLGAAKRLEGRAITDVKDLLEFSSGLFTKNLLAVDTVAAAHSFVLDRYWNQLVTVYNKDVVEAVLSKKPPLVEVISRVEAVKKFRSLPEAESLAAATKRARNILRKEKFSNVQTAKPELLVEEAEKNLARAIVDIRSKVDAHFDRRQFVECLNTLAGMRAQVDTFFDKVLVNAEDPKIRENRLALLSELDYLFNRVADISKLAA